PHPRSTIFPYTTLFRSLGCQHAQIEILQSEIRKRNPRFDKPLFIFEQQKSGSESAMMTDAIRQTFLGLAEANKAQRATAPLSKLDRKSTRLNSSHLGIS